MRYSSEHFHHHLNFIENSITLSTESEGQLAFLDVQIIQNPDTSIDSTTLYKYLDFTSHHPLAHKIAVE